MLSSVATIVLLAVVILTVWPRGLIVLATSLLAALLAVGGSAAVAYLLQRGKAASSPAQGRAFNLLYAIGFAALLVGVTAVVSLVSKFFGDGAAAAATAVAGAFDVHAAAASTLSLAAGGKLGAADIRMPILVAFSTNTIAKLVGAFVVGGRAYGAWVSAGLGLSAVAAWLPMVIWR